MSMAGCTGKRTLVFVILVLLILKFSTLNVPQASFKREKLCSCSTVAESVPSRTAEGVANKSVRSRIGEGVANWDSGLQEEVDFWRGWISVDLKGQYKYVRDTKLQGAPVEPHRSRICRVLAAFSPNMTAKLMLDHGAGPFTHLGARFTCPPEIVAGVDAQVIAVDPLASHYNSILNEFHIFNTLRTSSCGSERLSKCIGKGVLDFAIIVNALDHSENAPLAFVESLRASNVGGISCVYSMKNEAKKNQRRGFHQWNFDVHQDSGHWLVENFQTSSVQDMNELVAPFARPVDLTHINSISPEVPEQHMFVCYQKTADVPEDV